MLSMNLFNLGVLPILALLPTLAKCGQVPVVDGVIGGVPHLSVSQKAANLLAEPLRVTNTTTPGKLRFVENSGICETTPNVYQASGYGDLTEIDSIWFWFFAARNNPDTAPLTLWFNGGPGSTSMIGLFQEHGPCRITNDSSTVVLNPYSWNNESNIMYIDQPVGTGLSHGNISRVGTSAQAAADIWSFMQIFLSDPKFSQYQTRDLAIWTESYGGHYGPVFAAHFLDQNSAIANKSISGIPLNLKTLAIGNGLTDPLVQYPGYAGYAANNPYRVLGSSSFLSQVNTSWSEPNGCQARISACYNTTVPSETCSDAQNFCNDNILDAFQTETNFDIYFVPGFFNDTYPPDFTIYLDSVASSIGVDVGVQYIESNISVYTAFAETGDWMSNARPNLETAINAGIRTLIFDGDADFICNYVGFEAMVDNLNTQFTSEYKTQTFQDYVVAGQKAGQFKQAGNFTYIRVFGAGHEVAAYKFGTLQYGQAASQMFREFTVTPANQTVSTPSSSAHILGPSLLRSVVLVYLLATLTLVIT